MKKEDAQKFDLSAVSAESAPAAITQNVDVDGAAMIANLSSATASYCSLSAETDADKIRVYNAMANADEKLTDHVGETIDMKHVYVEAIECADEKTGEIQICPRIVILTADGKTYQAVSKGVFGSLRQIFQIFGDPATWNFALRVRVKQSRTRRGYNVNTLEAVEVLPD